MQNIKYILVILLYFSSVSWACDFCALHAPIEKREDTTKGLTLSIVEQFTEFSKLQNSSKSVANVNNQHLNSSITQLSGIYQFNDRFSVQTILPYIHRTYKRTSFEGLENGTVSGIGDMSLLVRYAPIRARDHNSLFILNLFSGLKLPTGNTNRLNDMSHNHSNSDTEIDHDEDHMDEKDGKEGHAEHENDHSIEHSEHLHSFRHNNNDQVDVQDFSNISAIHGHDLTLGTGSIDVPIGVNLQYINGNKTVIANAQYMLRTEGDYDYRVADDLMYNAILAYKISNAYEYNISGGLNFSGQYKKKDRTEDSLDMDTGVRTLFMGPALVIGSNNNLSADFSFDIPLDINNTGFQAVADYRIRAGLNFNF